MKFDNPKLNKTLNFYMLDDCKQLFDNFHRVFFTSIVSMTEQPKSFDRQAELLNSIKKVVEKIKSEDEGLYFQLTNSSTYNGIFNDKDILSKLDHLIAARKNLLNADHIWPGKESADNLRKRYFIYSLDRYISDKFADYEGTTDKEIIQRFNDSDLKNTKKNDLIAEVLKEYGVPISDGNNVKEILKTIKSKLKSTPKLKSFLESMYNYALND